MPTRPVRDAPGLIRPVQERSRRTLARLVSAALELIAERGVEGTSVHDIVERAGSSVGSFYARFRGKEDLVHYLEEEVWADARTRWEEGLEAGRWSEGSGEEIVAGLVGLVLDVERHGAAQRRALGREGRPKEGPADAFYEHIRRGVADLLRPHLTSPGDGGEKALPEAADDEAAERAIELVFVTAVGAARLRARRPASASVDGVTPDRDFALELSRMLSGYLFGGPTDSVAEGGETPSTDDSGEAEVSPSIDFFDVWG